MQLKSPKYKKFDTNEWITRPLLDRWDPLVFYICANEYQRVISIQVDETQEYRIFPDETPRFPSVRFLQIEQFKYVHWPGKKSRAGYKHRLEIKVKYTNMHSMRLSFFFFWCISFDAAMTSDFIQKILCH